MVIDRSVLSGARPFSRIVDTVLARLREVSPCEGVAVLLMIGWTDPGLALRQISGEQ